MDDDAALLTRITAGIDRPNAAGIAASVSSIFVCPGAPVVRRKASAISRDRAGAATIAGSARTASASRGRSSEGRIADTHFRG